MAGNPNPFKTPNGSVPQRGEVVLVTASLDTSKFLGIPNLKNMVYENRMPWANQWGLSSNVSFSTSPHSPYSLHSPCHPPAKFLSLTKSTSSYGQTSQATTTGSTLCGNKIPILKEAFVQFPKAKWLYWLNINIIITTPSINLHDHVLTQAGMNKNGAFGKELGRVGGGSSGYTTPATVDEN